MAKLEKKGYVVRIRRTGPRGDTSNAYDLTGLDAALAALGASRQERPKPATVIPIHRPRRRRRLSKAEEIDANIRAMRAWADAADGASEWGGGLPQIEAGGASE